MELLMLLIGIIIGLTLPPLLFKIFSNNNSKVIEIHGKEDMQTVKELIDVLEKLDK